MVQLLAELEAKPSTTKYRKEDYEDFLHDLNGMFSYERSRCRTDVQLVKYIQERLQDYWRSAHRLSLAPSTKLTPDEEADQDDFVKTGLFHAVK